MTELEVKGITLQNCPDIVGAGWALVDLDGRLIAFFSGGKSAFEYAIQILASSTILLAPAARTEKGLIVAQTSPGDTFEACIAALSEVTGLERGEWES